MLKDKQWGTVLLKGELNDSQYQIQAPQSTYQSIVLLQYSPITKVFLTTKPSLNMFTKVVLYGVLVDRDSICFGLTTSHLHSTSHKDQD